jgi:GT2 family glycosyltransferase
LTVYSEDKDVESVCELIQNLQNKKLIKKIIVQIAFLKNKSAVLNQAIQFLKGRWVTVIPLGDLLEPDATYLLLRSALSKPEAMLVYGDQTFTSNNIESQKIFFKPSFSIDLIYSQNYIGDCFAFNKEIVKACNALDETVTENWSHTLILKLLEKCLSNSKNKKYIDSNKLSNRYFLHVCEVIHHQHMYNSQQLVRPDETLFLTPRNKIKNSQGLEVLQRHFASIKNTVNVTVVKPFVYRHDWSIAQSADFLSRNKTLVEQRPFVTLIIPTRDGYKILKDCIESILKKTAYTNYEIIIVDNQSVDAKTLRFLKDIQLENDNIRVLNYDKAFNYSDINNYASKFAHGSILGFVNNDIEVLNSDWLTEMVSHAVRPDIGCVGALLFYPDGTIQHGGVIVGMHGIADHAFKALDPTDPETDYFDLLKSVHNPDAVTAAVLLMRKELFERVDRFDHKDLVVAFNDVDLCLKVKKLGLRNLFTPYAQLIHHESKTRSKDVSLASRQREKYEHIVMQTRWKTHKFEKKHMLRLYLS